MGRLYASLQTLRLERDVEMTSDRSSAVFGVVAIAIGLATLTSCTGEADRSGGAAPTNAAMYSASSDQSGGDAALLQGTIVVEDGCLYVDAIDGVMWVPIFADTLRVANDKFTYGSMSFSDGSHVSLTGGEAGDTSADVVPSWCNATSPRWRVARP